MTGGTLSLRSGDIGDPKRTLKAKCIFIKEEGKKREGERNQAKSGDKRLQSQNKATGSL
jgi:hypothetical protein